MSPANWMRLGRPRDSPVRRAKRAGARWAWAGFVFLVVSVITYYVWPEFRIFHSLTSGFGWLCFLEWSSNRGFVKGWEACARERNDDW